MNRATDGWRDGRMDEWTDRINIIYRVTEEWHDGGQTGGWTDGWKDGQS